MSNEPKEITEQESRFLALLFEVDENGVGHHPEAAKLLAGYPKDYPITTLVRKINKELTTRGDDYLALYSPAAIRGLIAVMNDPTEPGAKVRLQAVADLLDRAGITKKEKSEVEIVSPNFMFIIPSKKPIDED